MDEIVGKFTVSAAIDEGESHLYNMKTKRVESMPQKRITLLAVTDESGDPEDAAFYRSTPQGQIEMVVQNIEATKEFIPGRQFYLTLTPINK